MEGNKTIKALFDNCTPDLYRENPFRIAWIRSNASNRQVARHADKIKMMAEIEGKGAAPELSIFSLDPPPASDKIREAIQALKDPRRRIVQEFFWYWPDSLKEGDSDEGITAAENGDEETAKEYWRAREEKGGVEGAVAAHNMAVLYHMLALDWTAADLSRSDVDLDFMQQVQHCWERAFARWEHLIHNDDLWDRVRDRIAEIDDPALRPVAARHIRNKLPEALDKINAEVALLYATKNRFKMAEWHIEFMKQTHQGFDDVDTTITDVLRPAQKRINGFLVSANKKCREDLPNTPEYLTDLLSHTDPLLRLFDLFHAEDNSERNELFDEVALCCNQNLVPYYNKTKDEDGTLELLNRAIDYATSIEVREKIGDGIAAIEGNREFEKIKEVLDKLRVIQQSGQNPATKLNQMQRNFLPAFHSALTNSSVGSAELGQLKDSVAIVLREISISAHNDHEDFSTANKAIALAAQYATNPTLKSRIRDDQAALSTNEQLLAFARSQQRSSSSQGRGCLVTIVVGVLALVFFGAVGECGSSGSSNRSSTASSTSSPRRSDSDSGNSSRANYEFGSPRRAESNYGRTQTSMPRFDEPIMPLPTSGMYTNESTSAGVSPLKVSTRRGGEHYFVKVVTPATEREIAAIFIRGGESAEVDLPLGIYEIRYASGQTWYGPTHLFGPSTSYSKAGRNFSFSYGSGYQIELYKQIGGNLTTNRIRPEDF